MLKKHTLQLCCLLLVASTQLCAENELVPIAVQENGTPISPTSSTPINPPVTTPVVLHTPLPTTPFEPFTGIISGSKVRMRTQPSLEGHVVRETTRGDLFAVMGETQDYYAILPPKGSKGYVFRTFILDGKVEGERVNVRLSPDTEAAVVAQLNRGDSVETTVSSTNNKWLEIDLPPTSRFYIAKEYLEKKGGIELIASFEKKKVEAGHHLSAASLFAQSEIQKPFEQIDFDRIISLSKRSLTIIKNCQLLWSKPKAL